MTLAPLASLSLAGAMFAADAPPSAKVLSLANAEETALRHQPTLEQAFGQVEAAEGRVEQARAGYLPQLNGAGDVPADDRELRAPSRRSSRWGSTSRPTGGWSAQTFNFFTFGATATQLIYDFGADRRPLALGERQPRRRELEPARDREPDVAERAARVLPGARAARSGRGRRGRRAQPGEAPRTERRRW